jgi:hypothetical protein
MSDGCPDQITELSSLLGTQQPFLVRMRFTVAGADVLFPRLGVLRVAGFDA